MHFQGHKGGAADLDKKVKEAVASGDRTEVDAIVNSENALGKAHLARAASVWDESLSKLADDNDLFVRFALASNSSTPATILDSLADDKKSPVALMVARNPNTMLRTLKKLTDHKDTSVAVEAIARYLQATQKP